MNYAAFIITFERENILEDTINSLFQQSLPPKKILIVDNSETDKTRQLIEGLNHSRVEYYHVGYNSGPSGGAYHGLKELAGKGYDWIFWGDDDDPPAKNDLLEKIFCILEKVELENCGQLGLVGSKFNRFTGELSRIPNEELLANEIIEVDAIGGGQCKIISNKIAELAIYPEKKLFFGFEDLDIDIKIKNAGFKSYVSGQLLYQSRKRSGRLQLKKEKLVSDDSVLLRRQYYSIRSLLDIFSRNKLYTAMIYLSIKKGFSILLGFTNGYKPGYNNAKSIIKAYNHFVKGQFGKIDLKFK